jgi:hypothetical protein
MERERFEGVVQVGKLRAAGLRLLGVWTILNL